jgi:hypothetical protein
MDRFVGVADGLPMLMHLQKCFRLPGKHTIHFLSKEGTWQLQPHPKNSREQDTTVQDYVESILPHGYIPGCLTRGCRCPLVGDRRTK